MKLSTSILTALTLLFTTTLAHPNVFSPTLMSRSDLQKHCPPFDPAGTKNIGNGGQCLNQADCASGCCANPCGICSGVGAQFQAGKTGCGFGGTSISTEGTTSGPSANATSGDGSTETGNSSGTGGSDGARGTSTGSSSTASTETGNSSGSSCNGD